MAVYKLTCVMYAKFFIITLDLNLTWVPHINPVNKKCSKNLGVLDKVKYYLPETTMYLLYLYTYFAVFKIWYSTLGECIKETY